MDVFLRLEDMHPTTTYMLAQQRQADLMREADQYRLAAGLPRNRRLPALGDRLLAAFRRNAHVPTLRPTAARG